VFSLGLAGATKSHERLGEKACRPPGVEQALVGLGMGVS